MNQMVGAIQYKRLRAPRSDRQALIEPTLAEAVSLLEHNVAQRHAQDRDIRGRSLHDLQCEVRSRMIDAAIETLQAREQK